MKLSDYVAGFLAKEGIRQVYAITGGASLHLIDSLARTPGITYICPQHEQAGAMAADAYARATGDLGAAIATSGPGATNMITGICCSWFDSVPVLYLTGQVASFRLKGDTGARQIGFQETEVVDMVKTITKYAVMVTEPGRIRYELEKACHIARSGRPGPVLVDIPDDFQRADIDPVKLEGYDEIPEAVPAPHPETIGRCLELLERASRPVLILGWGIRLAGAEAEARELVDALGIPVLPTWPALDMIPSDHPLVVGNFGTHGTRFGNYTVQNADLVLAIGARLDTREAGSPLKDFARGARKIVVDIDRNELGKFPTFGMQLDVAVHSDAGHFIRELRPRLADARLPDLGEWKRQIAGWQEKYPICPPQYFDEEDLNPYVFMRALSDVSEPGALIVCDTGCALAWTCQAFRFKEGQRIFHAFNTTAMGYGLPGAIGVSLARGSAPVMLITGDGSLQMNIQELATVIRHKLPIKIFLVNNHGMSMVQQTQEQWLDGRYEATTVASGLAFPDFVRVAEAYGFPTITIARNDEVHKRLREVFAIEGPVFVNLEIRAEHRVIPQAKFGRPLEDLEPLIDRRDFFEDMLVEPLEVSRT